MTRTYSIKPADIERKWYLIDASENTLGRISTQAARLLIGKDKAQFSNHIDCGDYVVIINASGLKVTGNKLLDKKYYRHSGHPGGLHSITLNEQMSKDATKVIYHSVRGMLPVNKLTDLRLKRLKIYSGSEHQHTAQQPVTITVAKKGEKA